MVGKPVNTCDEIPTRDICDKRWMQQTGHTLLRKLFIMPAASHEKEVWHKNASSARQGSWGTQVKGSGLLSGCNNEVTGLAYWRTTFISGKSSPIELAAAITQLFKTWDLFVKSSSWSCTCQVMRKVERAASERFCAAWRSSSPSCKCAALNAVASPQCLRLVCKMFSPAEYLHKWALPCHSLHRGVQWGTSPLVLIVYPCLTELTLQCQQ